MKFEVCIVGGVEGPHISLNEYRIAGPKAWGGGTVQKRWIIDAADIERALRLPEGMIENNAKTWLVAEQEQKGVDHAS